MNKSFTKTKTVMIALVAIILFSIANAQTPRVMVMDFYAGRDIHLNDVAQLTSILTVYLQQEFEVVTLQEVDRIIREQGFDRATLTEQQIEIVDSLLNLSKIITGSINRRLGAFHILASVLDLETGTVKTTVGETGERDVPIRRIAPRLGENLLAEIMRSEVPVPQEIDVEDLLIFSARQRGVLINGVRWATSNVDTRQGTFTDSPEIAGRFNQWGTFADWSTVGTPRISPDFIEHPIFGSLEAIEHRGGFCYILNEFRDAGLIPTIIRDLEPPPPPAFRNSGLWVRFDPCPPGWRLPYVSEFESLVAAGSFWTTVNGVPGRIFGRPPNQIFLPAAGGGGILRDMEHIPFHTAHEGQIGYYWTRERHVAENAWRFRFSQVDAAVISGGHSNMRFGHSVRCVQADNRVWIEF